MPPGPRRLSRAGRGNANPNEAPNTTKASPITPAIELPILPKHFPFPNTPMDNDIFFDFVMALYAIVSAGLQFLHLYRSVWWLPNSYTQNTLNFYLIDPNLVIFIAIIFLRRLYYHAGCKLISKLYSNKSQQDLSFLSRGILSFFYAVIIGTLLTIVVGNLGKAYILYMSYPIILYLVLFGFQIRPFFELTSWCSNGLPAIHACTSNPIDVRRECEHLKYNLSDRVRQCLFTSVINAYYGGWIPCAFAPAELVYDTHWCSQHVLLILCSSFIFSLTHLIPLRYCDTMHRAVLHLGLWEREDHGKTLVLVPNDWRDDVLWPGGALVKYEKSVWRAMGDCNSIRPGDRSLQRYYKMFILPSQAIGLVLLTQSTILFFQLYTLVRISHWFKIISMAIMMFFNYYPMYKITRDFIVSYKIYKQSEESDEKKGKQPDTGPNAHKQPNLKTNKNPKYKTVGIKQTDEEEEEQSDNESTDDR